MEVAACGRSRSRSGRQRRSRKKPRRSGAADLEVRVARQGRELCGGLAPVAQQALLGVGSGTFRVRSAISR